MNAHKIAENLCIKAEAQGLCHPTEGMISECIDTLLSNYLLEIDIALRDQGFEKAADFLERLKDREHLDKQDQ